MRAVCLLFSYSICISSVFGLLSDIIPEIVNDTLTSPKQYMLWPNATVPFYVNPEHFDHEQSLKVYQALSMFAFKTCLKFAPVMAMPASTEHVLVFINPSGVKRCVFDMSKHSFYEPHVVTLGYECLKTPNLEMMIMKSLGFPFEHNREDRDTQIDIMTENIDPGYLDMYTRDINTPSEFRLLPYDHNSLMHFGYRDFSINGHRTFVFLNPETEQNRIGLTAVDIRKFDLVYGTECLQRDRQDQVELCRFYPDGSSINYARRKRETEPKADVKSDDDDLHLATKNLRVNPNITPPPEVVEVTKTLKALGIEKEVQSIVESVFKVSKKALANARVKYCKVEEKANVRTQDENDKDADILGLANLISDYAKGMVDKATANVTQFCEDSESMTAYLRVGCSWHATDPRCTGRFRPTKVGPVRYSTQHRPVLPQSTKNWPLKHSNNYVSILRGENGTNVQSEGDEQENVTLQNRGVTEGGVPRIKKSMRRHRQSENTAEDVWSIVKDGYREDRARTKPTRPHRQHDIYSEEDKDYADDNDKKDKEIKQSDETDYAFSEQRNIHPKKGIKNIDSDVEGYLHKKLKDKNEKSNYKDQNKQTKHKTKHNKPKIKEYDTESDEDRKVEELNSQEYAAKIIPKKKLKSKKYSGTASETPHADVSNQNNKYQVKKQLNDKEKHKKRHKKTDMDEKKVKTESEERKDGKRNHQIEMEEDGSIEIVQNKPKEKARKEPKEVIRKEPKDMIRNEQKKVARKEPKKKVAPKDSIEMIREEPNEMSENESIEMIRKEPKEMAREESVELDSKEKLEKKQKNYSEDESDKRDKKIQINEEHYDRLPGKREHETFEKEKRSDNGPLPATVPLTKENKEFYSDRKWRGGIIPYVIKPIHGYDLQDIRSRIEEVNAILKERTCTRLKEISEYEATKAGDYIYIDDSPDYVTGRVGGKQIFGSVELLEGGQHRQHTAMMVMAMLGFYFEVSRHDRDKYIRVHMRHVRPDKLHHFEMIRSDATLAVPYDYQSATHPSWQFWRQYGRSGISTVATYKETDPDGTLMKSLGQNTKLLSETDIVKINSVYGVRCFLRSSHKNRGKKEIWQRERVYESQYSD